MTSETVERTIETVESELTQARTSLESAIAAFTSMVANAGVVDGETLTTEQQFAVFAAKGSAEQLVNKLEAEAQRMRQSVKAQAINGVLNPAHDVIREYFTPEIVAQLRDAEVGNTVTFSVTFSEADNAPTINHRTSSTSPATKSESSGSEATGSRGRFTWGGMSAADYLLTNGDEATKAHVAKVQNKEVGYNDLSKRADTLLKSLGHEKVRVS